MVSKTLRRMYPERYDPKPITNLLRRLIAILANLLPNTEAMMFQLQLGERRKCEMLPPNLLPDNFDNWRF